MPAILPSIKLDKKSILSKYFMPHQLAWILAEDDFHQRKQQVFALAEKSVRIGWTYADAFKNIRKRLRFPNRDYLFATKDYPSALEYMRVVREFLQVFSISKAIISHGEDYLKVDSRSASLTSEIKISYIKFDNHSRIIAFSAHPQAMAVYGGDVGLDEFAKHPNAELLWQTAQGRVTWGYDMAVWSSHEGDDTLFHQFALQARNTLTPGPPPNSEISNLNSAPPSPITPPSPCNPCNDAIDVTPNPQPSSIPTSPWILYFKVTITDAIQVGLLDTINRTRDSALTPDQFLADCRARSGLEQIFQQAYMCNPVPGGASIVDWSAIERCRADYDIIRVHLEHNQIVEQFGEFNPSQQVNREYAIHDFLRIHFDKLFDHKSPYRLGFDVAASGQGDLAAIYVDEADDDELWLRALFTCRTEDWHFLQTVLFRFLQRLRSVKAAGDETGLGKQICWEAANRFGYKFTKVNFTSKKHDLGFTLMNQLATTKKRFPKSEQDIAADYFALRKYHSGSKWVFSEGRNSCNSSSHCDIAWAGALSSFVHIYERHEASASYLDDDGTVIHSGAKQSAEQRLLNSNDPRVWRPGIFGH